MDLDTIVLHYLDTSDMKFSCYLTSDICDWYHFINRLMFLYLYLMVFIFAVDMASFYQTVPDANALVVCPYDNVHMVAMKRLPYHLMKCRKVRKLTTIRVHTWNFHAACYTGFQTGYFFYVIGSIWAVWLKFYAKIGKNYFSTFFIDSSIKWVHNIHVREWMLPIQFILALFDLPY